MVPGQRAVDAAAKNIGAGVLPNDAHARKTVRMGVKAETPNRLEDCIGRLGSTNAEGGALFTELCAILLRAAGCQQVFRRKGSEAGRDIDCVYGGRRIFVECKRTRTHVDLASAAYKLHQVDLLADELKPDLFVLMSNGPVTSALKDVFDLRQLGPCPFGTALCVNENGDRRLDALLTAAADDVVAFFGSHLRPIPSNWLEMVQDFRTRAASRSGQSLLEEYFGLNEVRAGEASQGEHADFRNYAVRRGREASLGTALMLTAVPLRPHPDAFSMSNLDGLNRFSQLLAKWGLHFSHRDRDLMIYDEATSDPHTKTFFLQTGALTMSSAVMHQPIQPEIWLGALRENCLRLRNFAYVGLLRTPASVSVTIVGSQGRIALGGLTALLENGLPEADLHVVDRALVTEWIDVPRAFADSAEIGRALLDAFGQALGESVAWTVLAEETLRSSDAALAIEPSNGVWEKTHDALGWLLSMERGDRSPEVFAGLLGPFEQG